MRQRLSGKVWEQLDDLRALIRVRHLEGERAFVHVPALQYVLTHARCVHGIGGGGRLERIAAQDVGNRPMWVTIIPAS